jgi:hypothetical protein
MALPSFNSAVAARTRAALACCCILSLLGERDERVRSFLIGAVFRGSESTSSKSSGELQAMIVFGPRKSRKSASSAFPSSF